MRAASSLAIAALAALALAGCQKDAPPKDAGLKIAPPGAAPAVPAPAPIAVVPPAASPDPVAVPPPTVTAATPPPAPAPIAPVAASKPPAASPFDGAFDLVGTEPFWNMKVRPGGLTLSRPSHADLTAPNPGVTELGRSGLWTATAGQSRMTVTITRAACSDGMSERAYAYSAKVSLWGVVLSGCASKVKA